jgi:hypothetical protein
VTVPAAPVQERVKVFVPTVETWRQRGIERQQWLYCLTS